ncbi:DUF5062 family protein [Methyloterricola oryzae]|uniref:DUF5062 family protein n=1 Tax=Methyloterricola oryzae TaxID=1495050 RepID=UPI0005EBD17D|nr:DUF5062 family protein [Methyloterricola oryzae]
MTKLKNEAQLTKKALEVAENYAKQRGYAEFRPTDSAKEKLECLYRLLVKDKLIVPLPTNQENGPNMKHRLALWIARQLPKDHPLLQC